MEKLMTCILLRFMLGITCRIQQFLLHYSSQYNTHDMCAAKAKSYALQDTTQYDMCTTKPKSSTTYALQDSGDNPKLNVVYASLVRVFNGLRTTSRATNSLITWDSIHKLKCQGNILHFQVQNIGDISMVSLQNRLDLEKLRVHDIQIVATSRTMIVSASLSQYPPHDDNNYGFDDDTDDEEDRDDDSYDDERSDEQQTASNSRTKKWSAPRTALNNRVNELLNTPNMLNISWECPALILVIIGVLFLVLFGFTLIS